MEKMPSGAGAENKKELERIASAALQFRGKIYTGENHATAIVALEEEHPDWIDDDVESPIEGFLTSTGRFVNRHEAGGIARESKQLHKHGNRSKEQEADSLDSDDLLGPAPKADW